MSVAPAAAGKRAKRPPVVADPVAEAIAHRSGALLVTAGPGSGKTRIVVGRFKALLDEGYSAERIAALAFNANAAEEMRVRIRAAVGGSSAPDLSSVTTYHAFAQRLVATYGHLHGWHSPRIATEAEKWLHMAAVMKDVRPKHIYRPHAPHEVDGEVWEAILRAKQELVTPRQYQEWAEMNLGMVARAERDQAEKQLGIARLYKALYARYREFNVVDHDDNIMIAVQLLRLLPDVRDAVRAQFDFIMVDEFQDTNLAQAVMVEQIVDPERPSLMVVGDEDQSIYRFRGAASANFDRFRAAYPKHREIELLTNHRSTPEIIGVAQAVIDAAAGRRPKTVRPSRPGGELVRLVVGAERQDEALAIVDRCLELHNAGVPWKDMCVMFRKHDDFGSVTNALQAAEVPYLYSGGRDFFEAPEVRNLVALLAAIDNPYDSQAVVLCLDLPAWRMSPKGAVALRRAMRDDPDESLFDRLERADVIGMPAEDAEIGKALAAVLLEFAGRAQSEDVRDLLYEAMARADALRGQESRREIEAKQINANIRRLHGLLDEFAMASDGHGVSDAVRHLELLRKSGREGLAALVDQDQIDAVRLSTAHASKGLEFRHVMIGRLSEAWEEGSRRPRRVSLPLELIGTPEPTHDLDLEEDRRLLYVAATRAMDSLMLSYSERYSFRGKTEGPSTFLAAIPREMLDVRARPAGAPILPKRKAVPEGVADGPIDLSYTLMQAFSDCPRKYLYHLWRAPQEPSVRRWFGSAVHETLKDAGARKRGGETIGPDDIAEAWEAKWGTLRGVPNRTEELRVEGERILREYVASASWQEASLEWIEHRFEYAGELREQFNASITGIFDRVEHVDGRLRIIDYKSGGRRSEAALRRDLQMDVYAVAAAEMLRVQELDFEFRWLGDGSSTLTSYDHEDLARARRKAWAVTKSIRSAHEAGHYPTKAGWACRSCAFEKLCTKD